MSDISTGPVEKKQQLSDGVKHQEDEHSDSGIIDDSFNFIWFSRNLYTILHKY